METTSVSIFIKEKMAKCHFDAALAGDANKVGGTKEGANESVNEAQPQVINKSNVEDCKFSAFRWKKSKNDPKPRGITNTHPTAIWTPRNAYEFIKGTGLKERILEIRRLVAKAVGAEELSKVAAERGDNDAAAAWSDKAKKLQAAANEKKSWLPYVTFGGVFTERKNECLVKYSGLMCFDIDHVGDRIPEVESMLHSSEYFHTVLMFVSPRWGVKWVIRVELGDYDYTYYYKAVQKYLKSIGIKADDTSDISRPCFLCWDPDCYFAEGDDERESETFIPEDWLANGQNGKNEEPQMQLTAVQQRSGGQFTFVERTPELDNEIDNLVRRLVEGRIDITDRYPMWFNLALSFASYYGREEVFKDSIGLRQFLAISQFSPLYKGVGDVCKKYLDALNCDQNTRRRLAQMSEEQRRKALERGRLVTINFFIVSAKVALNPMPQPDPEHPYSFGSARSTSTEQEPQDNWFEEFCNDLNNENNDEK